MGIAQHCENFKKIHKTYSIWVLCFILNIIFAEFCSYTYLQANELSRTSRESEDDISSNSNAQGLFTGEIIWYSSKAAYIMYITLLSPSLPLPFALLCSVTAYLPFLINGSSFFLANREPQRGPSNVLKKLQRHILAHSQHEPFDAALLQKLPEFKWDTQTSINL